MSAQPRPVVYLVDDDDAVRDSLRMLMRSAGFDARTFANADEFLTGFDGCQRGCLVLDVRMPGMSGLDVQTLLRQRGNDLPVVFISGHGDIPVAVSAVKQGAVDFLQKPFSDQDLLDCVRRALEQGERELESRTEAQTIRDRATSLTPREREVMSQVVHGKANKVIASDLGVSQRTVEIHRARVMEKMQANSLAHLVRMVLVAKIDH